MQKSIKRTLVILGVFTAVLLFLQRFATTAASYQPESEPTTEEIAAGRPPITTPLPVTSTRPVSPRVGIDAPEAAPECTPIPQETMCPTFLPVIFGPPFLLWDGRIKLVQETDRVTGLTVFRSKAEQENITVTLSFSELQFSEKPQFVRAWLIGGEVTDYENYSVESITVSIGTDPSPGAQQAMVEFKSGSTEIPYEFTFFYIPNGDFIDSQTSIDAPWNLYHSNAGNPNVKIDGGNDDELKLYIDANPTNTKATCVDAKIGFAGASIDLELPADGQYQLFVNGIVYTQDQNPSNNATFDAFEIAINGNVVDRDSNQDQPIRCDPVINRQVIVDARIPLSSYSGNTTISLENHRRFDNKFDTYTEIDTVWIDY